MQTVATLHILLFLCDLQQSVLPMVNKFGSKMTDYRLLHFFSYGAAAQRGPWPPHSWGF